MHNNKRANIYKKVIIAKVMSKKNRIKLCGWAIAQRAIWQDSGSNPAETIVRTWKLLPRRNVSEAVPRQAAGTF